MKRFFLLLLALVCLTASALADGGEMSTDNLPPCYRYVIEGANAVYSGGPVPVYADKNPSSATIDWVQPWQHIHVDSVDRDLDMAYVFFYESDTQAYWNFEDDCLKGWLNARYITSFTDPERTWVVETDQPGNRLNLRRDGYLNVSLGKYYAGTIVIQLEDELKGGMMKVRIGHMEGLMDTRYLQRGMCTGNAELPMLTVANAGGTGANVRKLPEAGSEIVQFAPNGATVTVISVRDDGWYQVVYENETGFAQAELLTPRLPYNRSSDSGTSTQSASVDARVVTNSDFRENDVAA